MNLTSAFSSLSPSLDACKKGDQREPPPSGNNALTATKESFTTGNIAFDDSSGLSYVDRQGRDVQDALSEAETYTKWLLFFIIAISIFVLLYSGYKTFF